MKNLKVKIITGFKDDQFFTIDADEAHKAYYLFLNPEERGIFKNGIAVIGQHIQRIEPDYNATMGWNPSYKLTGLDETEIKRQGIDVRLRDVLYHAKNVAQHQPDEINIPLSEIKLLE